MHHYAGGGQYPWVPDPLCTDAWMADRRYVDSAGSVGIVAPNKGVDPIIQPTGALKGTYGADYGSQGKGRVAISGGKWMSCDALAAKVSGSPGNPPHDFTLIQSFDLLDVTGKPVPWGFGHNSNSRSIFTIIPQAPGIGVSEFWQTNWFDDAAHATTESASFQAATGRHVMTVAYNRASNRATFDLNNTLFPTTILSPFGTGQLTLTTFTIGIFRWSGGSQQPANIHWRGTVFFPHTLTPAQSAPSRSYLVREAA